MVSDGLPKYILKALRNYPHVPSRTLYELLLPNMSLDMHN
jgi:hypothetical protein